VFRYRLLLAFLILFVSRVGWAAAISTGINEAPNEREWQKPSFTTSQKIGNFGLVAAAQVASYYITQEEIIREHGSWKNWIQNPLMPHFDKDNFDFNIVKHSFVGHYYYLFYRSRGYSERSAFFWTVGSSAFFEFGIETFTERPSFQDLYLTPVFGSILGMGMERISRYFHSFQTLPTTLIGYLLNPMTLIPGEKCECSVTPTVSKKGEPGVVVTLGF
jgi:Domain of unknown function (DUF3943)